jgi:hypothetical protein
MTSEPKISDNVSSKGSIREFIYLDRPRLASYAAQLNNGIISTRRLAEMSMSGQVISSPTVINGSETVDKATGTAGLQLGVSLGGSAEFQQTKHKSIEDGGDLTADFSGSQYSQDKHDHDNLFESIEKQLKDRNLLSNYTGGIPKTPLIQVDGALKLMDWAALISIFSNVDSFQHLGLIFGDQKTQKQMKAMLSILKSLALPEVIANFSVNNHSVFAPLDLKHLNMPVDQLRTSYSMQKALKASLLAVSPTQSDEEHVSQGPFSDMNLGDMLSGIFGNSDLTVFPIAVYLTL